MAKVKVLNDDDVLMAEYFVDNEYVGFLIDNIRQRVNEFVVEQERQKLLAEIDDTLKERVNAKLAVVKDPKNEEN